MKKIAISGANGFIGRHLVSEFNSREVEITAIALPGSTELPKIKNGKWVYLNINNPPENIFETIGEPEILIHLAWGGLPNYLSLHHFESELPSHYAFLKQLISEGLKSLIITGTCFEYGMQYGPIESTAETKPSNPYGFAKDSLRRQLIFLQNSVSFNLTWARLFYVYGENQNESSIYSQLKKAIREGSLEFNMSGGEQLRDYLHVKEVASEFVDLALVVQKNRTVNICSGNPQSIRNLVEKWAKEENSNIKLKLGYFPYTDFEPMAFWGKK